MDGHGRIIGSLTARLDRVGSDALLAVHRYLLQRQRAAAEQDRYARPSAWAFRMRWLSVTIANWRIPRFAGLVATLLLFAVTGLYGAHRGNHGPAIREGLLAAGDHVANSAGLQAKSVRLSGNKQISQEDILELAGIGPTTSVLFFDPVAARERLVANPWIAEATVQKLYPDQLMVQVVEREAFALWQRAGKIAVIAADGAVIVDHFDPNFQHLPLVVGPGADGRAREIVELVERYPAVKDMVRAAVLVADRRWTLVLKNGTDVQLPETAADAALTRLVELDRTKRLMTRDLSLIDLRIPGRVAVRLSDDAFRAHEAAVKERQRQRRRGTAT